MNIVDKFIKSSRNARDKGIRSLLSFVIGKAKTAYKISKKNQQINRNVNSFIYSYAKRPSLPRETDLRLEVLIPCYNHGRFLAAALSSIPKNIPVTIIDDASVDDTENIVSMLKNSYTFKLIQNQTNLKQTGCLNKAIELSPNNLFMVLNADDCLLTYCVPTVLGLFESHPSIRMAGGSCIPFSGEQLLKFNSTMPQELCYEPFVKMFGPKCASNYSKMNDINMTMSSCTFLKSAWRSVGGLWSFSERVCACDDRDFQMRVSALFDVAVIEEPLALYRVGSSVSSII